MRNSAVAELEALKIVTTDRQCLSTMKERATDRSKHQFVVHPDYVAFYGQVKGDEPVQAGKRKMRTD